jgi:two-component system sensor histidine kinase/response regulator
LKQHWNKVPALAFERISLLVENHVKMKILVADDDEYTLRLLEILLVKEGYEVVKAKDGNQALNILNKTNAPSLAILDWMMPGIDGLGVLREIRNKQSKDYTYVLILTAKGRTEDLVAALEAGADDYVVKPFNTEELVVRLQAGKRIIELQKELLIRSQTIEDFVYAVSHDIRTPLVALEITANQTSQGFWGPMPEAYQPILSKTRQTISGLLQLTETLLAVASLDNKEITTQKVRTNLCTLAEECISQLMLAFSVKNIEVSLNSNQQNIFVQGDPEALKRVFINLLDNASKYTPHGGSVRVSIEKDGREILVSICDTGHVLSQNEQKNLFQRFAGSEKRKGIGFGLGLYLAKQIVTNHGGNIQYCGTESCGNCFSFTLPSKSTD